MIKGILGEGHKSVPDELENLLFKVLKDFGEGSACRADVSVVTNLPCVAFDASNISLSVYSGCHHATSAWLLGWRGT